MFLKPLCAAAIFLLPMAALAAETTDEQRAANALAVSTACANGTNMPAAICTCVGDQAAGDLSADQQAFVIAAFNANQAEATRLRGVLSGGDLVQAATFMASTPQNCMQAGGGG